MEGVNSHGPAFHTGAWRQGSLRVALFAESVASVPFLGDDIFNVSVTFLAAILLGICEGGECLRRR